MRVNKVGSLGSAITEGANDTAANKAGSQTYLAEQFEAWDLGAPFVVILEDSVEITKDSDGKVISYKIPNVPALMRAIVIRRCLHPRKLGSKDIKFIRKATGEKQKDVASKIDMTTEYLSRCENGTHTMSHSSEKLFRIWAITNALKERDLISLNEALAELFDGVKLVSAGDAIQPITLFFTYKARAPKSSDDGSYAYRAAA